MSLLPVVDLPPARETRSAPDVPAADDRSAFGAIVERAIGRCGDRPDAAPDSKPSTRGRRDDDRSRSDERDDDAPAGPTDGVAAIAVARRDERARARWAVGRHLRPRRTTPARGAGLRSATRPRRTGRTTEHSTADRRGSVRVGRRRRGR
jgi:hypothetical protein